MKNSFQQTCLVTFCLLLFTGCGSRSLGDLIDDLRGRKFPSYEGPEPKSLCESPKLYTQETVTVRGMAYYQARVVLDIGLGEPSIEKPIRHMEIAVFRDGNDIEPVQCSETSADGSFTFKIPKSQDTYRMVVRTRSSNNQLNASLFNRPEKNNLYGLETSFQALEDKDLGKLMATAKGEILGAAFNILDQMLNANKYLRKHLKNCSKKIKDCRDFIVAPNVNIYWEKGFNPGYLFNDLSEGAISGSSFYIGGNRRLFILGGSDGDVLKSDTDHFDNSVILHEYGHFLEDVYAVSNSPGGSHSGNKTIDPRLAFSEGWSNFFQAAVLNEPFYKDTVGNISGETSMLLFIPIEVFGEECELLPNAPGCDFPTSKGEGNYREFAVTRLFWDAIDREADQFEGDSRDLISDKFIEIWASFTKKSSSVENVFRAMGAVLEFQENLIAAEDSSFLVSDWSVLKQAPSHKNSSQSFAASLKSGDNCENFSLLVPAPIHPSKSTSFFNNNQFFRYTHSGGNLNLKVSYVTEDSEKDTASLSVNFIASSDNGNKLVRQSRNFSGKGVGLEKASWPSGEYLIRVQSEWSSEFPNRGAANYHISKGGVKLCPDSISN